MSSIATTPDGAMIYVSKRCNDSITQTAIDSINGLHESVSWVSDIELFSAFDVP
ncbi:hypothetical protein [Pantoea ananatis]|uniref:hypothetical protein n=1 Tax=Pantoea ananas TaxID=553 RepID=UPI003AB92CCF